MAGQPPHHMSQNTNGLPLMYHPQPHTPFPALQQQRSNGERINLGPLSDNPPANDLESTDGSGHGSPIPTASMASPLPALVASPLPPHMLTTAAMESLNTGVSSPSNMPEIPGPRRPESIRLLTETSSNIVLFGNSPMPPLVNERSIPVLIDYSALLKCASNAQQASTTTDPQLGNLAWPKPSIVMEIAPLDALSTILDNISTEILNQHVHNNDHELAVDRMDKIQLSVQWNHGQYFGQNVMNDAATFRRCLKLMEKRGWKDHFVVRVNDSIKRLEGLNVVTEIEESNDNSEEEEEPSDRRPCSTGITSTEMLTLGGGGVPI